MLYSENKKRGFTLVELIVVLVILAILAALLIPALTGYIDKAKKDQVIAETRMLHEAVQTEMSEIYAGTEWKPVKWTSSMQRANPCTLASSSGRSFLPSEPVLSNATERYQAIVKLSEVPSLQEGTGKFFAFINSSAKVHALVYDSGRGYIGVYFRDTQQYSAYKIGEKTDYGTVDTAILSGYFGFIYYNNYFDVDPDPVTGKYPVSDAYIWSCSGLRFFLGLEKYIPN